MADIITLQKNEPHAFTNPYSRNAFGWPINNNSTVLTSTDIQPQSAFMTGEQNYDESWRQDKRTTAHRNNMLSDNLAVHTSSSSMLPSMSVSGGVYPSSFLSQQSTSAADIRRPSIPQTSYSASRIPYLSPGNHDHTVQESFMSTRQALHGNHHHEKPAPLDFTQSSMIYSQDHQRRASIETPTVSRFQSLALQSPFHSTPLDSPSNLHSFISASSSSPVSHAPVGPTSNPMTSGQDSSPYGNDEHHRIFGNWSPTTPSPSASAPPPEKYAYYSNGKKLRTNSNDDTLLRTSNPPFTPSTPQYSSNLTQQQRSQGIKAISISVDNASNDNTPSPSARSSRKRSCDGEVYNRQRVTEQQQQQSGFPPPTHIVSPEAILKAQAEEEPENERLSFSSYFDKRLSSNSSEFDSNEPPFIRRRKSVALGLPLHEQQGNNIAPSFSIPTFSESAQTRSPSSEILSDKGSPSPEESVSAPLTNRKFSASGKANHSLVSVVSNSGAAEADALSKLDDINFNQPQPIPLGKKERLKRPPNAYLLFNRDTRHKLLESMPHLTVAEISKEIGERWKALSPDKRDYYMREASLLKKKHLNNHPNFIYTRRSKAELAEAGRHSKAHRKSQDSDPSAVGINGDPPRDPRGRKKKRHKNPTAPKHPMSGFLFYLSAVRPNIAQQHPGSTVGPISKMIAQQWRNMDKNEREPWNKKAEEDKKRYAREMREYAKTVEAQQANQKDKASDPPSPSDLDSLTIATVAQMVKLDREGDEQSDKSPTASDHSGPDQMHVPVSPEYSAMEEVDDEDDEVVDKEMGDTFDPSELDDIKPRISASAPIPAKSSNII